MKKEELIKLLYNQTYLDKINKKYKMLGIKNKSNPYDMILTRLITTILVFIISFYIFDYGQIVSPIISILYYLLFNNYVYDEKLKKRSATLESEAMHFFEVLTLSLETGRNLIEAILVTTDNVEGLLSEEFRETIRQVEFGKSLNESLNDMQERIPSDTINNIILSLTQANLYGNSIITSLYNQIDYLREKRRMTVKGRIAKVPVYISIISVLFFIPLLMIIILGPVLLNYVK